MQAGVGVLHFRPIDGEYDLEGRGATAIYCLKDRSSIALDHLVKGEMEGHTGMVCGIHGAPVQAPNGATGEKHM